MGPPLTRTPAWHRTGPEAGKCLDVLCGRSRRHTPESSQECRCCVLCVPECNMSVLDPNPAVRLSSEVLAVGVTLTRLHLYITTQDIFLVIFLDRGAGEAQIFYLSMTSYQIISYGCK